MNPKWRIYYANGSTYSDLDGPPEFAPVRGVISIAMIPHVPTWNGGDLYGRIQYELEPGWKKVLWGQTVPNRDFVKISGRAADDPDFSKNRWNLNRKDFYWWVGDTT